MSDLFTKPKRSGVCIRSNLHNVLQFFPFNLICTCRLPIAFTAYKKICMFGLVWCLMSQSTAMVMPGRSVHLTTLFLGKLDKANNQFFLHIPLLGTDNPSWISGREENGHRNNNWAVTWDFQQCGMCDRQSLRSACKYVQSDQSLC